MNFAEQFVASAFQSLGYFVIQDLKVGVRDADLLAARILNGKLEYYHIEIQVSYNPAGVLRAHANFGVTGNNPTQAAGEYIAKKFFQKDLVKAIEKCFGTKRYKRIFVYGSLKNESQLKVFIKKRIQCISLESLAQDADSSDIKTSAFINFFNISKMVHKG